MSSERNYRVKNKNSSALVNGQAKLPTPEQLEYGEIAINYAAGHETISIKNNENKIITLSSTEDFEVIARSLNDLNYRINEISASTSHGEDYSEEIEEISGNVSTLVEKIENNDIAIAGLFNNINDKIIEISGATSETIPLTEVTWSDLKSLRDNDDLIPGMQYRITDYVTTTSQNDTQSANHPFDIIVVADTTSKLNENARAALHSGDTYFSSAGCKLESWKIWYCLDNDINRFAWAESGATGRGVIYRMIDEWNNDCPYDFKNIQFKRYKITACPKSPDLVGLYSKTGANGITVDTATTYWCYTFSMINLFEDIIDDVSVFQEKYISDENAYYTTHDNIFESCFESIYSDEKDCSIYINTLPLNVFVTDTDICAIEEDYSYGEFYGFYSNTFGNNCYNNTIGSNCNSNTFGNNCGNNTFGNGCNYNTFGNGCNSNTFGNSCFFNTFGNYYHFNIFGDNCDYNTFGNNCFSNTFGKDYYYNTFGNNCFSNTFGNNCNSNTFGNHCYSNTFGNNCDYNTFGNDCGNNTFGNNCDYNTFGNNCFSNTFGGYCFSNTFGNECKNIRIQKEYVYYIIVENGNNYIDITSTQTTSSSNILRNFKISQGVNNTTTRKTISHNTVNDTFQTIYANDASGNTVAVNIADIAGVATLLSQI